MAPRPDTAEGLPFQCELRGISVAHTKRLKRGRRREEGDVFMLPRHVEAVIGGAMPECAVFDVTAHDIGEGLLVRLHLLDCRPVLTALRELPAIGLQVAGIAAVRIPVVTVLRVQGRGEAKLPQIGEADGLPASLADCGKDWENQRSQQRDDGNHNQQLDQYKTAPFLSHGFNFFG